MSEYCLPHPSSDRAIGGAFLNCCSRLELCHSGSCCIVFGNDAYGTRTRNESVRYVSFLCAVACVILIKRLVLCLVVTTHLTNILNNMDPHSPRSLGIFLNRTSWRRHRCGAVSWPTSQRLRGLKSQWWPYVSISRTLDFFDVLRLKRKTVYMSISLKMVIMKIVFSSAHCLVIHFVIAGYINVKSRTMIRHMYF